MTEEEWADLDRKIAAWEKWLLEKTAKEARAADEIEAENTVGFSKEMVAALEADGEKLRQLTGDDHGPFWPVEHTRGTPITPTPAPAKRSVE